MGPESFLPPLSLLHHEGPPCRAEAPTLEKLNATYSAKGVAFVGVNVQNTETRVETQSSDGCSRFRFEQGVEIIQDCVSWIYSKSATAC